MQAMGRRAVVGCVVALLFVLVGGVVFLNLVGVTDTTAAAVGCTGEVRTIDGHLPNFMPITRPEPGTTVPGKVAVNRLNPRSCGVGHA